jgi:hypothetical protein
MKASEFSNKIPEYLDGTLSVEDKKDFEQLLESNPTLKSQFEEFRAMENMLKKDLLQEPSRNFTVKVMGNLANYPLENRASMFNAFLLVGGIIVLVSLCILLSYNGFFDSAQTQIDLNKISVVGKYMKRSLPSIPFNGKLVVHMIIFLNLVLVLIVLDRAIFKPLFQRRMQNGY